MEENILPEQPCELCQDKKARLMAGYSVASITCQYHTGDVQKACLALIVPLEQGDADVDPEDVLSEIMLLGDPGKSIDATAELLTSIIENAAKKAANKANANAEMVVPPT